MHKVMLRIVLVTASIAGVSTSAIAGTTLGTINHFIVSQTQNYVQFSMTSTAPVFAACATKSRYVVSTDTQAGRNMVATLIAAKNTKQTIQVGGTGTCTLNSIAEDVSYIEVY